MCLAYKLQQIQKLPSSVKETTRDLAMKDVIDPYLSQHNSREKSYPLLAKVLAGETTFQQEYEKFLEKFGENNMEFFKEEGNMKVIGWGEGSTEQRVALLDGVIKRLYL